MGVSHTVILVTGLLCLVSILAGLFSARFGTPLLLVFIAIGMVAGEDGPGGIQFDDFQAAYLVGSLALAAILFQGGLSTERRMIRLALWPSVGLATVGVAVSTVLVGAVAKSLFGVSWPEAFLLGAVTAPTDAAAVSVLLHLSGAAVPSRVVAALEVESGLNDPMSVFLTVGLVDVLTLPGGLTTGHAALLFVAEMGGGAAIGLAGGSILVWLFRRLRTETSLFPVLAVGASLTIFGGAQVLHSSGFLAVYLAGIIAGNSEHQAEQSIKRFFGALGWLAQIALFLMLGLLATPHELLTHLLPALVIAATLILIARPVGVLACLLPFRWSMSEAMFIAWVGLRGAVPIFLTIIPLLTGVPGGRTLFDIVFVVVIISIAVQGWTIAPAARLLRLEQDADATDPSAHGRPVARGP